MRQSSTQSASSGMPSLYEKDSNSSGDAPRAQLLDRLGHRGQRGAPRIDADRGLVVPGLGEEVDRLHQEVRRQVVDAVVPAVLEHAQRDAFPRAGETADENQLHHSSLL